jgi:hypothetical protein
MFTVYLNCSPNIHVECSLQTKSDLTLELPKYAVVETTSAINPSPFPSSIKRLL